MNNKDKKNVIIGLLIFLVGLIGMYFTFKIIWGFFICLTITLLGWYIFSYFHSKINIEKIKKITNDYIESMKNK